MSRCILFLLALMAPPLLAQPLAPPPEAPPQKTKQSESAQPGAARPESTPSDAAQAPAAPPSPELTPEQILTQFRRDEINLLALRGDTRSLLAAALMAMPDANDKSRPSVLKSTALLARAQKSGEDAALVWWVSVGLECHATPKTCPQAGTLQQLEASDAQNAAMWSLALARAQQTKDTAIARAALTSAAQAPQYDDHFGLLVAVIRDAADILPISEDVLRASGQHGVSSDGFKLTFAASVAASLPQTGLHAVVETCGDTAKTNSDVAADCVAVAQKIIDSGSLITRAYGVKMLLDLLPAGEARDAAQARGRRLAWQTQRIGELAARLTEDPRVTRVYVAALRDGRESDAVEAVLRNQGIALEPPADWQAPQAAPSP